MTHECQCDGPGHCPRFDRRMTARLHQICSGRLDPDLPPVSEATRAAYVASWSGQTRRVTAVRVPLALRPVCVHQGSEIPGCKTCGGEGAIIRYCESPDDDADRCVRGRSRDPAVRSCLECAHYSPSLPPGEAGAGPPTPHHLPPARHGRG